MPKLSEAIISGDIAKVRAALDEGENPNESDSIAYPVPLELAFDRNKLDIFKLLLSSGANPNIATMDTLLITTILRRRIDFTEALLECNVDVDQPGRNNASALRIAYQERKISFDITKEIINKTKEINQRHGVKNNTLLSEAVERDDDRMVKHLLQLNDVDADVLDSDGKHALAKAVEKKNYSIAKQLAVRTNNLNAKVTGHDSMLKCAIVDEEFDFAVNLVELGADVNVADHEESILHCALNKYAPEKLISALIAHGAKCDVLSRKTGDTPLHIALRKRRIELVKAFLVKKVDPNWPDSGGATPLYTACKMGNVKLVELLLEYGANPLIKNTVGSTLHMAGTFDDKTIFKALQAVTITAAMQAEAKQYDIATAYSQSIENMSKIIILGQETVKVQVKPHSDMQVISNNEGYGPTVTMDHVTHGEKLTVEVDGKEYPVGYNIYIPEGIDRVNKVLVTAYGGETIEDIDKISSPARLNKSTSLLLSAGCVVIELNLPDVLQRKHQTEMDADLQKQVHAAIHKFYQTISQDPLSLHENLDKLGFKLGVYTFWGASFGGRTSVRHAQLYPRTFKSYIAHDGVFADLVDMPIIVNDRKYAHSEVLLPIHHVESTLDPILFFHNRDDNNVNIKNVLKFYDALLKAGKGDLARLCFFEKGSPITCEQKIHDKGHLFPDMELSRYVDAILTFMDSGPSQIPELHQHFHLREKQLANQFFRLANGNYNVKKRFLALAIQRFKDNTREQDSFFKQKGISWDEQWAHHYRPILKVLGEIRYLVNDAAAFMTFKESLISQDLLNDVMIEKAVRSHAAAFREYYKETHDFEEISIDDICNNPFIICTFRDRLTRLSPGDSKDFIMFLLESLLFANPELLSSIHHSKAWTQESFEDQERNYKQIFEASARESKASMQRVWQAVIKKVIDKQKTRVEAFDLKNIDDPAEVYKGMFLRDTFFVRSQEDSAAESLKIQTEIIARLTDINLDLIESIHDRDVEALAKPYLMHDQAKLSKLSEESLGALAALLDKREEIQPEALELLVNILIIDKAIDPLHKGNTIKAIKRQAMLSQFIQHSEIQYKAENSWHAELKHVYPDLNIASILRLNSIIKRGMQNKWQNPLIDVIKMGDTALAKVLTELVPDTRVRLIDSTALELACEKDDLGLVKMLSERGVSVSDKCLANAQNSSPEIIAYLIEKGAKPLQEDEHRLSNNSILENPVFARLVNRALVEDNRTLTSIVKALAKKYNCKAQFTSMTELATKLNQDQLMQDDVVHLVQLNQLDVNFKFASGHTLLMYAIENNHINLVRALIEKRVQLDIKDRKGFRAIHHAFYKQKIECAEIILKGHTTEGITDNDRKFGESLLSSGSNYKFNFDKKKFRSGKQVIIASQNNFEKLFRVAIEQGNLEQAIELLCCVLNLNTNQSLDISLLSSAIKADATQFAICLLKAGANANSLDMNGDSCLFLALNQSDITLVKALIEHGANVNTKNRDGKTCLDIANDMGNRDIVEHIMQKSAKPLCPSYLMYGRAREQTSATTEKEQKKMVRQPG